MNDEELLRYSRQILLPQIGIEGQQRLAAAHVLIIGAGGLGSPLAMYLAAAGIGRLSIADHDQVELSNLQRQILHSTADIGRAKTASAAEHLSTINPHCQITPVDQAVDAAMLGSRLQGVDLVCDASDNFATRFAVNAACKTHAIPLVSGAAIRWEGQISIFTGKADAPCYQCLYPADGHEDQNCTGNGVIAPLVGIIGAMQALEAIKLICAIGTSLEGRLLLFDALTSQWRELRFRQDPACPICQPIQTGKTS